MSADGYSSHASEAREGDDGVLTATARSHAPEARLSILACNGAVLRRNGAPARLALHAGRVCGRGPVPGGKIAVHGVAGRRVDNGTVTEGPACHGSQGDDRGGEDDG